MCKLSQKVKIEVVCIGGRCTQAITYRIGCKSYDSVKVEATLIGLNMWPLYQGDCCIRIDFKWYGHLAQVNKLLGGVMHMYFC